MKYTWWTRLPVSSQKTLGNYPALSISKYTVYYCTVNKIILILSWFYFCIKKKESHFYKYYTRLAASPIWKETLHRFSWYFYVHTQTHLNHGFGSIHISMCEYILEVEFHQFIYFNAQKSPMCSCHIMQRTSPSKSHCKPLTSCWAFTIFILHLRRTEVSITVPMSSKG